jgi:hypothetical protein
MSSTRTIWLKMSTLQMAVVRVFDHAVASATVTYAELWLYQKEVPLQEGANSRICCPYGVTGFRGSSSLLCKPVAGLPQPREQLVQQHHLAGRQHQPVHGPGVALLATVLLLWAQQSSFSRSSLSVPWLTPDALCISRRN